MKIYISFQPVINIKIEFFQVKNQLKQLNYNSEIICINKYLFVQKDIIDKIIQSIYLINFLLTSKDLTRKMERQNKSFDSKVKRLELEDKLSRTVQMERYLQERSPYQEPMGVNHDNRFRKKSSFKVNDNLERDNCEDPEINTDNYCKNRKNNKRNNKINELSYAKGRIHSQQNTNSQDNHYLINQSNYSNSRHYSQNNHSSIINQNSFQKKLNHTKILGHEVSVDFKKKQDNRILDDYESEIDTFQDEYEGIQSLQEELNRFSQQQKQNFHNSARQNIEDIFKLSVQWDKIDPIDLDFIQKLQNYFPHLKPLIANMSNKQKIQFFFKVLKEERKNSLRPGMTQKAKKKVDSKQDAFYLQLMYRIMEKGSLFDQLVQRAKITSQKMKLDNQAAKKKLQSQNQATKTLIKDVQQDDSVPRVRKITISQPSQQKYIQLIISPQSNLSAKTSQSVQINKPNQPNQNKTSIKTSSQNKPIQLQVQNPKKPNQLSVESMSKEKVAKFPSFKHARLCNSELANNMLEIIQNIFSGKKRISKIPFDSMNLNLAAGALTATSLLSYFLYKRSKNIQQIQQKDSSHQYQQSILSHKQSEERRNKEKQSLQMGRYMNEFYLLFKEKQQQLKEKRDQQRQRPHNEKMSKNLNDIKNNKEQSRKEFKKNIITSVKAICPNKSKNWKWLHTWEKKQ